MSLRRRIAAAAAVSVAGVAVAVAVIGYASTRSQLIGEVKQELWTRARPELVQHNRGAAGRSAGEPSRRLGSPPPQPFGGAPGYFQIVYPNGTARVAFGEDPKLPVNARVIEIARQARGSFFASATVHGVHLEVLTVGDAYDHYAIQVALPLTGVDSVASGLLLPYGLLIGGGVLMAGLTALVISRAALEPSA